MPPPRGPRPRRTAYTDTGLTAGTVCTWTVAALDAAGEAGAASAPVTATTTGGATATCCTGTNYAQVAAGRAHTSGGNTYANGSNANMGLYNVFVTHTPKESPAGYFVIADTGCAV